MAAESFQVAISCKPSESSEKAWKINGSSLKYSGNSSEAASYEFSHVFAPGTSHAALYEEAVSPLVAEALGGRNVAVVAYGLPQTGKSRAIFGTPGQTRLREEARGVIVRCGKQLFETLEREEFSRSVTRISATFFHVFEDGRVADLFDTKKRDLEFLEDKDNLTYSIPNLTEHVITSPHDVLRLTEKGCLMRNATGCVKEAPDIKDKKVKFGMYGKHSSPATLQPMVQPSRKHCSHAVFVFSIEHSNSDGVATLSRITIADLAGKSVEQLFCNSPSVDSGMKTINKILTTLPKNGIVSVASLFSKSSLSKALKPCFGGNCKTVLIGTISLSSSSSEATKKCLELLTAARSIKNFTRSTTAALSQTKMGRCLEDIHSLKENVAQRLKISPPLSDTSPWKVVGATAVRIGGTLYEELCSSEQDLLKRISEAEAQLIRGGSHSEEEEEEKKPSMRQPTSAVSPLAMQRPSARPSPVNAAVPPAMISSSPLPSSSASTATAAGPRVKTTSAPSPLLVSVSAKDRAVKPAERSLPVGNGSVSDASTSSLESVSLSSADSVDEPKTPTLTGPAPPPLRGIPHIKPDPQPVTITAPPIHVLSKPLAPPPAKPEVQVVSQTSTSPTQIAVAPSFPTSSARRSLFQDSNTTVGLSNPATTSKHTVSIPPKPVLAVAPTSLSLRSPPTSPTPIIVASSPIHSSLASITPSPLERDTSPSLLSSTTHSPSFPVVNLSPIRPIPPPLTQRARPSPQLLPIPPPLPAKQQSPLLPTTSSGKGESDDSTSSSDSSSSLKLTSESDMEDEARDHFDPNMQQRRLVLHPLQPYMASSAANTTATAAAAVGGIARLPILPPISSPLTPSSPPHTPTSQFVIPRQPHNQWSAISGFNQPPTYQQASSEGHVPTRSHGSPPNYTERQNSIDSGAGGEGGGGGGGEGGGGEAVDLTQYMSSEEIHMAATDGVKSSSMKKLAIKFGVDYRDHGGRTPLMYAILGNQPKMCEVLVKLGAAINAKDTTGLTPLLWATYLAKHEVMKVLLRSGADVQCTDQSGRNPYHWAMKTPLIQCLKWLTKYASSQAVNHRDKEGLSPLHVAVMCDQPSHVRLLLSSTAASVSVLDKEGRTPLNYAVLNYSTACIRAILDCNESAVSVVDSKGRAVLHYACAEGNTDCVRTLLTYRSCNPHCTDSKGTTPLHWAAAANQPGIIQLLLRRGADRVYRDCDDMTPLDYAQQRGHSDCARILQTYGLRRPLSAVSVHSHSGGGVGVSSSSPALDEHGHIVQHKPGRRFSLSGVSLSSMDRLPADGQAQSESTSEENGSVDGVESSQQQQEDGDSAGVCAPPDSSQVAGSQLTSSRGGLTGSRRRRRRRSRRWWLTGLCGCTQSNVVVPVASE